MSKKTIIFLSLSTLILILFLSTYLIPQKNASTETVCKKKTSTSNSNQQTKANEITDTENTIEGNFNSLGNTNIGIFNNGILAEQGNWVYFNNDGLCKSIIDMKIGFRRLNYDYAEDINVVGNWIYYTIQNSLYRISIEGNNKTKLLDEKVNNVIVSGSNIYYISILDNKIYKTNLDGNNKVKILDEPCNSFSLDNDWIYYINPTNLNSKICKVKTNGTNRTQIFNSNFGNPVVNNNYLYYIYNSLDSKLIRMKLDGSEKKEFITPLIKTYTFQNNKVYYIDYSQKLYKIDFETNNKVQIADLSKYTVPGDDSLCFVNNSLLLFSNLSTDILKINDNGTIEKIVN